MVTQPIAPIGAVTAQDLLRFMVDNHIDSTQIFDILCSHLNQQEYRRVLAEIDAINASQKPPDLSKAAWEGQNNQAKGHLFEELMEIILRSVEPFTSWNNVHTSTSEIDILVQLGPTGLLLPALREWGTHVLCECKFSHDSVSIQWVTNLNTVLQTHNTTVGLLFTTRGLSARGNGARAKRQIEILSVMTPARFIVCLNGDDLKLCAEGFNFLRLLSQRYMEVKANTGRLRLLGG
ncbi:MAG: restriction endonuclease [Candidatus Sulfotelmatobacter sp.]